MDIYRKGIIEKFVIFIRKKYKLHRRVPDDILNQIILENDNK